MTYRLVNESRLTDETAAELVAFAWEHTPVIVYSTAIKLLDNGKSGVGGHAGPGALRKWAGRARHMMTTSIPAEDWDPGGPRVCWHSTQATQFVRARYRRRQAEGNPDWHEQAVADTERWLGLLAGGGATHLGQWPIYEAHTVEEAVVHTLAHELMHVLQADRGRGKQSELLCEEHALRVLLAYQEEAR